MAISKLKNRWLLPFFIVVTGVIFVVTLLSRLLFHGYIFNFDYHLYQPDGSLYTYMALEWSGLSHLEAATQVIDWYRENGEEGTTWAPSFFDPSSNPASWSLVGTRVLYPLLSTPLVQLFGIPGMLVVPGIAFFIFFLAIASRAWRNNAPLLGLLVLLILSTSLTVSRWYLVNYTDSLLAGLFAVLVMMRWDKDSYKTIRFLSFITVLIALTSLTRFCLPYWVAISLVLFFRREFRVASFILVLSVMGSLPALLARPDTDSIVAGASGGFVSKLLYFPISALKILFIEVAQLAAIDRSLLLILVLAFVLAIKNRKELPAQFYLGVLVAGWFIGALNGVLGVNFRYQLPVIAFACWVILDSRLLQEVTNRLLRRVFEVRG